MIKPGIKTTEFWLAAGTVVGLLGVAVWGWPQEKGDTVRDTIAVHGPRAACAISAAAIAWRYLRDRYLAKLACSLEGMIQSNNEAKSKMPSVSEIDDETA